MMYECLSLNFSLSLALSYAHHRYMTPHEFDEYLLEENSNEAVAKMQRSHNILSSWMAIKLSILHREMDKMSIKLGVNLAEETLVFDNSAQMQAILKGTADCPYNQARGYFQKELEDGHGEASLGLVATFIYNQAAKKQNKFAGKVN